MQSTPFNGSVYQIPYKITFLSTVMEYVQFSVFHSSPCVLQVTYLAVYQYEVLSGYLCRQAKEKRERISLISLNDDFCKL